jgi:hypothetical protein
MKMIDAWVKSGALAIEQHKDEKRNLRDCIVLGNWEFGGRPQTEPPA